MYNGEPSDVKFNVPRRNSHQPFGKTTEIVTMCPSVYVPLGAAHSRMTRLVFPYVIISSLMTSTEEGDG